VDAAEGPLSASSLMMESLMACGRHFVLLAFKSKPVRFGWLFVDGRLTEKFQVDDHACGTEKYRY
jgi:hypothetical protein